MRILVIPELRERQVTDMRSAAIEEGIQKVSQVSTANLFNWSVFAPAMNSNEEESTLEQMSRGYHALSLNDNFLAFDVYIGFLSREDFEEVDAIIYESEAAKQIAEARFKPEALPKAKEEIIISGEMSIENEIYKRTSVDNRGSRA